MVQFSRPLAACCAARSPACALAPLMIATSLLATLAATPAAAQPSFLQALDLDGNGAVTVDEAIAARNLRFDQVDQDGDGEISPAEYDKLLQDTRTRYASLGQGYVAKSASPGRIDAFTFSDSDADGVISRAEYHRNSARFARSLDRNGDGRITAEELQP